MNFMNFSDEEVSEGIRKCVSAEVESVVSFLQFLIEVERRELFLHQGAYDLQDFCVRLLGLSEGTARKRVWVSRAVARFPLILEYLSERKLHLTAVSLLVTHLTEENHSSLLMAAVGKTENEIKWMLAKLFPKKLPPDWDLNGREKLIPLDGERAKFLLVVDREFIEKLNRSKEVHKHEFPDGNALGILKNALTKDLHAHDPSERAKRARTRTQTHKAKPSRKVLCGIKYRKREEAGHQCSYVSPLGIRCTQRAGLELDHQFPWAMGGPSDDENNIELLCMAHNRWKGRRDFNKDFRRKKVKLSDLSSG
jgi:hypothetical protein